MAFVKSIRSQVLTKRGFFVGLRRHPQAFTSVACTSPTKTATTLSPDRKQQCFINFHAGQLSTQEDSMYIHKSPLRNIEIPQSPFLPHYIFEKWNTLGSKVALIDNTTGREYTYDQLKDQITRVGSALVKQGFKKGDVITLFLPNCVEFSIFYLGAMSLGMTVSPVNFMYTQGELEHVLTLADSRVLVVAKETANVARLALPLSPVKSVICIDGSEGFQPYSSLLDDDGKSFPDHIEYDSKNDVVALPFSSGTTGLPKGVMITSYNIVASLEQIITPEMCKYLDEDRFICSLPLFHVFGQIIQLLSCLRVGATTLIPRRFDPMELLEQIQKYRPTYLHVVPPMLVLFAKHPLVKKCDFSSLNHVFYGAATSSPAIVAEAKQNMNTKALFRQGYGLTESTLCLSVVPSNSTRFETDTVGVVTHNTDMKIRDVSTGQLLGPNQEGELCCRGPQIMKGYLKNETATKQTLIDGWLHTGDLAFYDEEGYLKVTGRLKELIKYKGYQVAPAELEALLLRHPDVADAAVIGKPDEMAGELPRAYVVLKAYRKATEDDIQKFVKENAAPQKQLRGGVEFRSAIPKSAAGKILRKILKDDLLS